MAATVQIVRKTGASPGTANDITGVNTRMVTDDVQSTNDQTKPIKRKAGMTQYSFWANIRLTCTVAPSGTVNNIRVYTDGTNNLGTGITVKGAKASTGADAGYRQATGTPGDTGTQLTQANHTGLDAAPVDIFTYTQASPLSLSGSISNPNTGEFGDHFVFQAEVADTAAPGATPVQETIYWKYDET